MVDYYEEFGIDRSMTIEEIGRGLSRQESVWKRRRQTVPDKAVRKLSLLADARDAFRTERSRADYDARLEASRRPDAGPSGPSPEQERTEQFAHWEFEARKYIEFGDFDLAKTAVENALRYLDQDADNAGFYHIAADAYVETSDYGIAISYVNKAIVCDKDNSGHYLLKACVYVRAWEAGEQSQFRGVDIASAAEAQARNALEAAELAHDDDAAVKACGVLAHVLYHLRGNYGSETRGLAERAAAGGDRNGQGVLSRLDVRRAAEKEVERRRRQEEMNRRTIEEEKIAEEKRRAELSKRVHELSGQIDNQSLPFTVAAGHGSTVGLMASGRLVSQGLGGVSEWSDVAAVAVGDKHVVGLTKEGRVVVNMVSSKKPQREDVYDPRNISGYRDIIDVDAGQRHAVALFRDGRVIARGDNSDGQCNVAFWKDIVAVEAGGAHTVGIKSDGWVLFAGVGGRKYPSWHGIKAVSVRSGHIVGLRQNGGVVAWGSNDHGQCEVSGWRGVIAVSAGSTHTVGLHADGTVVACGNNDYGQCDVSGWRDVITVSAGGAHTVGLLADGTVVACGSDANNCVSAPQAWQLFSDSSEVSEAIHSIQKTRQERGLCKYCGGRLKGLISKKCVRCGRSAER